VNDAPPAPAASASAATPQATKHRDVAIDIVRGVAILALILVNFPAAAPPDAFLPPGQSDRVASLFVRIFLGGKFYTLFAILFGFSFVLFTRHRESIGTSIKVLWIRRMLVLLAIGYAHAIFVWHGDILGDYARAGLLLIFVRRWSMRTLVLAAASLLALLLVANQVWYRPTRPVNAALAAAFGASQPAADGRAGQPVAPRVPLRRPLRDGGYLEVVKMRAVRQLNSFKSEPLEQVVRFYVLEYFAFFLIGVAAARRLLPDPLAHRRLLLRTATAGIIIALPIIAVLSYRPAGSKQLWGPGWANHLLGADGPTVGAVVELPTRTLLALAYGALLLLACGRDAWRGRLRPLAAVGQMGLTNYLLAQSVFFTSLLYGYGFGVWGVLSRTDTLLIGFFFFVAQIIGSSFWLRYFNYGPVEWAWRSGTYWRFQPLRRRRQDASTVATATTSTPGRVRSRCGAVLTNVENPDRPHNDRCTWRAS
jgi:uncharacterized protein